MIKHYRTKRSARGAGASHQRRRMPTSLHRNSTDLWLCRSCEDLGSGQDRHAPRRDFFQYAVMFPYNHIADQRGRRLSYANTHPEETFSKTQSCFYTIISLTRETGPYHVRSRATLWSNNVLFRRSLPITDFAGHAKALVWVKPVS
jgi:hypothetical protein